MGNLFCNEFTAVDFKPHLVLFDKLFSHLNVSKITNTRWIDSKLRWKNKAWKENAMMSRRL